MKKILVKIKDKWIRFWGNTYKIYDDNKEICRLLVYHKTVYILRGDDTDE